MKGIDIFCASQASTAICASMDQASSSSSIHHVVGGRAIDRYNPIIRDTRRSGRAAPCSSQPPINPKPYNHRQQRSSRKKSSAKSSAEQTKKICSNKPTDIIRKIGANKPEDSLNSPTSSRYLLSDDPFFDVLSDNLDPVLTLVPVESKKPTQAGIKQVEPPASKRSSSSRSPDQVVVLRVSLHCKGCEGKVRKHISRMEGVTSFNIDFAAKKVTVRGDVTPLGVLASISKVKSAQLWPPAIAPPTSSTADSTLAEIKNQGG